MNEVEKMYRNCNIKKYRLLDRDNKLKWVYPPFTAEKQLELIKWLAIGGEVCRIDATEKGKWFVENDYKTSKCFVEFTEALANVINDLWQDLTDAEKVQIRGILE